VNGNSLKFKNLKLSATAGLIRLRDGEVENLDIKTNVGVIVLSHLQSTNAQIFTQFGSVCAHVFTSVVSSIEVTYGSVFAEHIGSLTSLSIISQLGKVYVTELFSTTEFTASVDYGFLTVKPSACFQGSFRVATEHGTALINSQIAPAGENGNVIVGKYGDDETSKDSIDLKSTYSIVRLAFPPKTEKKDTKPQPPKNNGEVQVDPPKVTDEDFTKLDEIHKANHDHGKGGKREQHKGKNHHKSPHKKH